MIRASAHRMMRLVAAAAITGLAGVSAGHAQTFPSKPVRIISGVGVGGTFDIFIRSLAEALQREWGQAVVIEPRPGGNFVTAARTCATAAPDGYTLCSLGGDNLVFPEFLVRDLGFNIRSDLKPIINLFFNPQMLVVTSALNARTLDEVAAAAKQRPKTLAFVAPAPLSRLFMEDFNRKHGLDIVNVPFRGGSDALGNLLSGSIHFIFTGAANFAPLIEDGKIYPLVVDSTKRLPDYPNVPTVREAGYTGAAVRNYLGLVGQAQMPDALVSQINAAVNTIMNDPTFRKRQLLERGLEPANGSPEDFAAYIAADRIESEKVVKEANLPMQ
jgi:tripartite-type tricarboxylate transporter receptor subunit TctC